MVGVWARLHGIAVMVLGLIGALLVVSAPSAEGSVSRPTPEKLAQSLAGEGVLISNVSARGSTDSFSEEGLDPIGF